MFGSLPGGSPGPGAKASLAGCIVVSLITAAVFTIFTAMLFQAGKLINLEPVDPTAKPKQFLEEFPDAKPEKP